MSSYGSNNGYTGDGYYSYQEYNRWDSQNEGSGEDETQSNTYYQDPPVVSYPPAGYYYLSDTTEPARNFSRYTAGDVSFPSQNRAESRQSQASTSSHFVNPSSATIMHANTSWFLSGQTSGRFPVAA
jgi:hypothetical protein